MFKPDFSISNRILNNIASIEAAEETIRHAPLLPLWEKEFKDETVAMVVLDCCFFLFGKDCRDLLFTQRYRKYLSFVSPNRNATHRYAKAF